MANLGRNEIIRVIALVVLVILEGLAIISASLELVFLPTGSVYPNIASVAILILPVLIGAFSRQYEVAVVGATLPFFILALVYTAVYAPVWNIDLFQLGVLASRVAGGAFLMGGLGAFGLMLRRIVLREAGQKATS
ncbi:MAG TPA: hypothetical protein VF808_04300 [Ktedonobacterales bacterium]